MKTGELSQLSLILVESAIVGIGDFLDQATVFLDFGELKNIV